MNEVDFQPEPGYAGEPSFEIQPPEAPATEAAIVWRWATAAHLPTLRVCHFQSEVEAGKEFYKRTHRGGDDEASGQADCAPNPKANDQNDEYRKVLGNGISCTVVLVARQGPIDQR
jgi:hypothetical protein